MSKQNWSSFALVGALALGVSVAGCGDDDDTVAPPDPPAPTAPGAPSAVAISVDGTSITVTWSPGSGATSHRATLSSPGESARSQSGEMSATFTDLTAGATYTGQVFAINSVSETPSAAVTAQIPEETPTFEVVTEDILENTTWTSDKVWILQQPTFVGSDCGIDGAKSGCVEATLTIEPGTTILGRTDLPQGVRGAYLVVSRGSQLVADATDGEDRAPTADEVIVFTSDKPRGQRDRGDWGGLIINGQAQTNAGDEAQGEGDSGFFGGEDDLDSSGILRGVRIEFAGDRVTPSDELNGLALQGVGSGTTISYVQIHYNVDDGIEPFGGTASVDHLVVTGIGDDSVDGTDGYRGFMQFVIGQQRGDEADNGMELSNDGEDANVAPQSTAVIANATMIGGDEKYQSGEIAGPNGDRGVQFREGSHYRIYNSIFRDFGDAGFCVENAGTVVAANNRLGGSTNPSETLTIEGSVVWNNAGEGATDENFEGCSGYTTAENKAFFMTDGFDNMVADPMLREGYNNVGSQESPPDIVASAAPTGYTAFDLSQVNFDGVNLFAPTDGRTLVATDYPGAVAPGTALNEAWYYGWTVWSIDGSDSRPNQTGN